MVSSTKSQAEQMMTESVKQSTRVDNGPRLDSSEVEAQDSSLLCREIGMLSGQVSKLLQDYGPKTEAQRKALAACQQALAEYPRVSHGIILLGPTGTGKTHLLAGLIHAMIEKEFSRGHLFRSDLLKLYKWHRVVSLIADYREVSFRDKRAIRNTARTVKFLVLDDLATENSKDFALDVLLDILDYRYEESLPTFLTSNVGPEELSDRYGDRFVSRFRDAEKYERLLVDGPDHRKGTKGGY